MTSASVSSRAELPVVAHDSTRPRRSGRAVALVVLTLLLGGGIGHLAPWSGGRLGASGDPGDRPPGSSTPHSSDPDSANPPAAAHGSTAGFRSTGEIGRPVAAGDGFRVDAEVGAVLVPGGSTPINLRLVNPHSFGLVVTSLVVDLGVVDAPHANASHACSSRDFALDQLPAGQSLVIPANSSVRLSDLRVAQSRWPRLEMLNRRVNQDGCKGASLRLVYTAVGRKTA